MAKSQSPGRYRAVGRFLLYPFVNVDLYFSFTLLSKQIDFLRFGSCPDTAMWAVDTSLKEGRE